MQIDHPTFVDLVTEAIDAVPEPFSTHLAKVAVVVEVRAPADEPDLYGLYTGLPLDEGGPDVAGPPPHIAIFMHPLADDCDTLDELREEIRVTLLHELGHHLGFDEDDLDRLGYG